MNTMKKLKVVFLPSPGIGHLVSTVEFAKCLVIRDGRFSITVITMTAPFANTRAYTESVAASVPGIQFIDLPQVNLPAGPETQSGEAFLSLFIENHKPHVKHTIINHISSESKSDSLQLAGLFVDFFTTTMIDVANELGIPAYLYFTSGAAMLGLMLHLQTLYAEIATDLKDYTGELRIPSFLNSVPPLVLPSVLLDRKGSGYAWFLYHARRFKETKGIVVNTFSELEPHALNSFSDGQNPAIYSVGPVLDLQGQTHSQSDRAGHDKIMKWLDKQPPSSVIFLCFGSWGAFGSAQVTEIADGIERSGYRFLWSLRQPSSAGFNPPSDYTNLDGVLPEGFLERTDGKGLVCGWTPQVAVLAHHAIGGFVSHCGWNSVLESLWFGVPIAVWPLYAEQKLNAFELVKELGLAVEIREGGGGDDMVVVAEEVERGVRSVMDGDNEVRKRVQEMGENSRKSVMEGGSSFASFGRLIKDLMERI
ncbi:hypothetical protein HHK36_033317 [Tetracentron sinense]|uniref:Glycosyltransferase n=1 Tax=Tetracentron sinense TaxID=13715 RepID=A0A834Y3X4_TETSI|nr:hypothetical protein HHK36_033317 [Tetracentron sinense]